MLKVGTFGVALFCLAAVTLASSDSTELASGFKYYHSRISPNSDELPTTEDCTGDNTLIKSSFLFVYGLQGFRTSCHIKLKPDQISADYTTFSSILKVELPAFIVFGGFTETLRQQFDRNATCKKGIEAIFKVSSWNKNKEERTEVVKESFYFMSPRGEFTGSMDNCIGIFHVDTQDNELITIDRLGLYPGFPGLNWNQIEFLIRSEDQLLTAIEYYEMMNCGSEIHPLPLYVDDDKVTRSPSAVHAQFYPSGTECFYQVEPTEQHCHTVISFRSAPENCHEWQMTAHWWIDNQSKEITEKFECGGDKFDETHDNPPWIIHDASPLVRFQFGAPGEVANMIKGLRHDDYALTASCLHTD